jgi:ABC-type transport system involved in cytochrome c biogenesis permease subunit
VEVNKPLKAESWKIYQYDYDARRGPESQYSVFLLVRDPWLPGVYLGIFLMLAGALCLIVQEYAPKRKWVLLAALVLTVLFTFLTVSRMGPSAISQPPALQSPWFIPHLIVYMAGYAILATATLMAIYRLVFKKKDDDVEMGVTDGLVYVGLAFLTIGMLFGALWAKEAWGNYWSWDPKETWAAITWLCYLVYLHFRKARPSEWRTACWMLLFAFVCLQLCWWGINYLPSAQGNSVHTYNS